MAAVITELAVGMTGNYFAAVTTDKLERVWARHSRYVWKELKEGEEWKEGAEELDWLIYSYNKVISDMVQVKKIWILR